MLRLLITARFFPDCRCVRLVARGFGLPRILVACVHRATRTRIAPHYVFILRVCVLHTAFVTQLPFTHVGLRTRSRTRTRLPATAVTTYVYRARLLRIRSRSAVTFCLVTVCGSVVTPFRQFWFDSTVILHYLGYLPGYVVTGCVWFVYRSVLVYGLPFATVATHAVPVLCGCLPFAVLTYAPVAQLLCLHPVVYTFRFRSRLRGLLVAARYATTVHAFAVAGLLLVTRLRVHRCSWLPVAHVLLHLRLGSTAHCSSCRYTFCHRARLPFTAFRYCHHLRTTGYRCRWFGSVTVLLPTAVYFTTLPFTRLYTARSSRGLRLRVCVLWLLVRLDSAGYHTLPSRCSYTGYAVHPHARLRTHTTTRAYVLRVFTFHAAGYGSLPPGLRLPLFYTTVTHVLFCGFSIHLYVLSPPAFVATFGLVLTVAFTFYAVATAALHAFCAPFLVTPTFAWLRTTFCWLRWLRITPFTPYTFAPFYAHHATHHTHAAVHLVYAVCYTGLVYAAVLRCLRFRCTTFTLLLPVWFLLHTARYLRIRVPRCRLHTVYLPVILPRSTTTYTHLPTFDTHTTGSLRTLFPLFYLPYIYTRSTYCLTFTPGSFTIAFVPFCPTCGRYAFLRGLPHIPFYVLVGLPRSYYLHTYAVVPHFPALRFTFRTTVTTTVGLPRLHGCLLLHGLRYRGLLHFVLCVRALLLPFAFWFPILVTTVTRFCLRAVYGYTFVPPPTRCCRSAGYGSAVRAYTFTAVAAHTYLTHTVLPHTPGLCTGSTYTTLPCLQLVAVPAHTF